LIKYDVKISRARKRVKVIRDPNVIKEEVESYNTSKYLRGLLNKDEEKEEIEEINEDELLDENQEDEDEELNARLKRIEELKAIEKRQPRFYQEFFFANENKPVEIDLSNIKADSIPLNIAKEQIQRAYEDGMDDGQINAMATYKTEIAKYQDWVRRFDSTAEDLKKQQLQSINSIEKTIIDLSVLIAQQILDKEIQEDKNIVIKQVRKAIESIKAETIFKIHVNPEAYELLKEIKSKLIEEYQLNEEIKIHPNPTVPLGSCLLETSAGLIDARINNQLYKINEDLEDEAMRNIESEEIQDEMNSFYSKQKADDEVIDNEKIDENISLEEDFDVDNMSYDDIPDEYKDMFEENIFGSEDLDIDGEVYQEPSQPENEDLEEDFDSGWNDDDDENNDENIDDIDRDFDDLFG
jgi:flagellar assembly protein FliH